MVFFWGYRTHTIVTKEGICLVEKTLPNNLTDADVAFVLIKELKRRFRFKKGAIFIGDKAYDVRELYTFIVEKMKSTGRWVEGNRERIKFRCPIKAGKKVAANFGNTCPVKHPSYDSGKCYGCTKYLDVTDDARSKVPRDSKEFKKIFKDRQIIEQYFSRLGDREVEQTTHYQFNAIRNQMTIAHLSASLIAVAAAIILKQPEKICCYRTFAHLPKISRAG